MVLDGVESITQQSPQTPLPGQLDDSEGKPLPQHLAQFLPVALLDRVTDEREDEPALIYPRSTQGEKAKASVEA